MSSETTGAAWCFLNAVTRQVARFGRPRDCPPGVLITTTIHTAHPLQSATRSLAVRSRPLTGCPACRPACCRQRTAQYARPCCKMRHMRAPSVQLSTLVHPATPRLTRARACCACARGSAVYIRSITSARLRHSPRSRRFSLCTVAICLRAHPRKAWLVAAAVVEAGIHPAAARRFANGPRSRRN